MVHAMWDQWCQICIEPLSMVEFSCILPTAKGKVGDERGCANIGNKINNIWV